MTDINSASCPACGRRADQVEELSNAPCRTIACRTCRLMVAAACGDMIGRDVAHGILSQSKSPRWQPIAAFPTAASKAQKGFGIDPETEEWAAMELAAEKAFDSTLQTEESA